jgi:hypothetical protein
VPCVSRGMSICVPPGWGVPTRPAFRLDKARLPPALFPAVYYGGYFLTYDAILHTEYDIKLSFYQLPVRRSRDIGKTYQRDALARR